MDIQAARAKRSSMPNVPPPPISARMTATGGKHRPEKPLRKLRQLAKSSREDQPCRSLRKLPVNQSHESPSPLHKSIRQRTDRLTGQREAENERKQAEKQAEPDMEETWDLSDPADPLNIGMGWGTGGHGLGL